MAYRLMNRICVDIVRMRGKKALKTLDENSLRANALSESLLLKLVRENAGTEYGKKYHFDKIKSIEDYKKYVPFSEYDDYAPYIERMIRNNETGLITAYPVVHYALTSGSVGVPKHIPVSDKCYKIYSSYGSSKILAIEDEYYLTHKHRHAHYGRVLSTVEVNLGRTENGVTKGNISGVALASLRRFLKYISVSPEEVTFPTETMDMKYMKIRYALQERDLPCMASAFMTALVDLMYYMADNWQLLCDDIETGKINEKILVPDGIRRKLESELKPDPERAEELRREFRKGFDTPIVPRIWKDLDMVSAIGTGGFTRYTDKMRQFLGPDIPIDFSIYGASESLLAVSRHPEEMEYVLLPDSGFYEFIPEDAEDESVTCNIDQLEPGKNYEIVLTNLSGFYRYRLKDVVKVTGYYNQAPKLRFAYRKNQVISIAGEKTNEEALGWAVQQFAAETGCRIDDYCVYADMDVNPGRYVVLAEPDREMRYENMPEYSRIIEKYLGQANPSFGTKIRTNVLGETVLLFSQPQTHALYRDMLAMKGFSSNQIKPVRVLDTPRKKDFFFKLTNETKEYKEAQS